MPARFDVQHQPEGSRRMRTMTARSWDAAAHQAVNLARGKSSAVTILRYDRHTDDGWTIAGVVRDMEGHAPEPHVYLLQDLRTGREQDTDLTDERAASARLAAVERDEPTGRRSRMRIFGVARPFARS